MEVPAVLFGVVLMPVSRKSLASPYLDCRTSLHHNV